MHGLERVCVVYYVSVVTAGDVVAVPIINDGQMCTFATLGCSRR